VKEEGALQFGVGEGTARDETLGKHFRASIINKNPLRFFTPRLLPLPSHTLSSLNSIHAAMLNVFGFILAMLACCMHGIIAVPTSNSTTLLSNAVTSLTAPHKENIKWIKTCRVIINLKEECIKDKIKGKYVETSASFDLYDDKGEAIQGLHGDGVSGYVNVGDQEVGKIQDAHGFDFQWKWYRQESRKPTDSLWEKMTFSYPPSGQYLDDENTNFCDRQKWDRYEGQ
jgi:hypothetical protein